MATLARERASKARSPFALGTKLGPPRPQPACCKMQGMLARDPNGAVNLMGDRSTSSDGLTSPDLGNCHCHGAAIFVEERSHAGFGCNRRCRRMPGQHSQLLLDGLERGDGLGKLDARAGVVDRLHEHAFECTGHRDRAQGCACQFQVFPVDPGDRRAGRIGKAEIVTWLACHVRTRLKPSSSRGNKHALAAVRCTQQQGLRVTSAGNASGTAFQMSVIAVCMRVSLKQAKAERPRRKAKVTCGKKGPNDNRFAEWDRQQMTCGGPQQSKAVGSSLVRLTVGVGQRVEEAGLLDRIPEGFAPFALFGAQEKLWRHVLREQAVCRIMDQAGGLVHGLSQAKATGDDATQDLARSAAQGK